MRNGEDITSEKICEGSDTSLNAFIEGTFDRRIPYSD